MTGRTARKWACGAAALLLAGCDAPTAPVVTEGLESTPCLVRATPLAPWKLHADCRLLPPAPDVTPTRDAPGETTGTDTPVPRTP
jgi:hypothetical protein